MYTNSNENIVTFPQIVHHTDLIKNYVASFEKMSIRVDDSHFKAVLYYTHILHTKTHE